MRSFETSVKTNQQHKVAWIPKWPKIWKKHRCSFLESGGYNAQIETKYWMPHWSANFVTKAKNFYSSGELLQRQKIGIYHDCL